MTTIPSMMFLKTSCLKFHRRHCSSLITNCFKPMIIRGLMAAGLNRYQSVWTKCLEPRP